MLLECLEYSVIKYILHLGYKVKEDQVKFHS